MPDLWLYWIAAALFLGMALRTVAGAAIHVIRAPVIKQAEVDRWADRQRADEMDLRISNLQQLIRDAGDALSDHEHNDYHHDHWDPLSERASHEHPHEHPHEHEHVQHVHQLEDLSREVTEGRPVIVKRCRQCKTIFRDEAS